MLNYIVDLPLEWAPQGQAPADDSQRVATNGYILEAVTAVEEIASDHPQPEEQRELYQELRRMDAKLHLLLDMVSRLLATEDRFPRRHTVRIAVDCIDIAQDGFGPGVGDTGVLSLYLHPAIPMPLLLPGHMVDAIEDDAGRWLRFEPAALSEAESDALARYVFRHHRRGIAAARQTGPEE